MDFDQLVAFERIAREGSFSRAALAIGIGQPAASARIHALEAALGGALFTRGRRIGLTPLGEGFLPVARRLLETLEEGVQAARLSQRGHRGRISLGALGSLAGGLVGPALAGLIRDRPEIECSLKAADHEALVELLLDGIIELALVAWPCSEALAANLVPLLVLHERVVLVAHPRHAIAADGSVSPGELARRARPLLRLRWWQAHEPEITRLAQLSGTFVEVPMEIGRQLVRSGVGAGFFTRTFIAEDMARGDVKEVRVRSFPPLFRDSALVRKKRSTPLSPAAGYLVELIREQARRLGLLTSLPVGNPSPTRQ
jgi:DNA-binding transcriptional LysR family regulator